MGTRPTSQDQNQNQDQYHSSQDQDQIHKTKTETTDRFKSAIIHVNTKTVTAVHKYNTQCLKKLCKIVFVRTSSNFHQF